MPKTARHSYTGVLRLAPCYRLGLYDLKKPLYFSISVNGCVLTLTDLNNDGLTR